MNDAAIRKALRGTLTQTEEDYQPTKLESYVAGVFGCKLTSRQRQKLAEVVTVPSSSGIKEIGSANDLYENDPDFPAYVESKVNWALKAGQNLTQAVNRTRCVGAICKFFDPHYGWLVFKERRLNDGRNQKDRRTQETRDGEGRDFDQSTARPNPTLGQFLTSIED